MPKQTRKRLEVHWTDSQISRDGWESIKGILARRDTVRCQSVGYVLADDKDGVVLAGSLNAGNAVGVITIPASQIVKRRELQSENPDREGEA